MRTQRLHRNPRHLTALRLGVTIVSLVLLAGSILLVWLIDDRDAALIITLAAILVGWVLTLILGKPSAESPTHITNFDDDNSPSLSLY